MEARFADLLLLNDNICRFGRRQSVDSGSIKEYIVTTRKTSERFHRINDAYFFLISNTK